MTGADYRPEPAAAREDFFGRGRGESLIRTPSIAVELSTVRRIAASRAAGSRRYGFDHSRDSFFFTGEFYHRARYPIPDKAGRCSRLFTGKLAVWTESPASHFAKGEDCGVNHPRGKRVMVEACR